MHEVELGEEAASHCHQDASDNVILDETKNGCAVFWHEVVLADSDYNNVGRHAQY